MQLSATVRGIVVASAFVWLAVTAFLLLCFPAMGATILIPTDQPTIQAGISAASEGDTVLVMPGTYSGPGNKDIDFGGVCVTLRGIAGAESTIVDCMHSGRGFDFNSGEGPDALLVGFTITNGTGENKGGGISCSGGSSPTIVDMVLLANEAQYGGGIYCSDSSPILRDVDFINNASSWGGGIQCDNSSPLLEDCTFVENSAEALQAGAMGCRYESCPTLVRVEFRRNYAGTGGAVVLQNSHPSFTDVVFSENTASSYGGCIRSWFSSPTFQRAAFTRNGSGDAGGVLFVDGGSCTLISSTLFANSGSWAGGIACIGENTSLVVESSIICGCPRGKGIACPEGMSVSLSCCDIYGNEGGDWTSCISEQAELYGNMSVDPLFCDAWGGELMLCEDSPCLPENHPAGDDTCSLVGAWGAGCPPCGPSSASMTSWGAIKAFYR